MREMVPKNALFLMEKDSLPPSPWTLGPYLLIKTLGKGGMGEVFLAFDPICKRSVAIKKIREELLDKPNIHERFLREARIASRLTHPSIIPIFSIHSDPSMSYYTMPYVEGKTLKELLQKCKQKTENAEPLSLEESLPSLLNVFLKICQAIGYSHSKGILHCDLKPDNVIVGKFGEVLLLDWGIAKSIDENEKEEDFEELSLKELSLEELSLEKLSFEELAHEEPLTKPGKIAGTITYLAPERAFGQPSSYQTDIYALGVMLYQILTLTSPFRRTTLADLRKKAHLETLIHPKERAFDREIPMQLSEIAIRSLAYPPELRYQKVEDLMMDLKKYIDGLSSWIYMTHLQISNEKDWEIHENILLAKHTAITRSTEFAEWASLMVSKASFSPNIKIEAEIEIHEESEGIGLLLGIPEEEQRSCLEEGMCLWCGSERNKNSFLLRSQVLVKEIPQLFLSSGKKHLISFERMDNCIRIFFNGALISSYTSLLPLTGTHVGILYKDTEFSLHSLKIYSASGPLKVHCMAIPDAFFEKGHFDIAWSEYRRIALSFSGRAEARDASFRAGLCLLERAKHTESKKKRSLFFNQALDEFEHLHKTKEAPLKYLGGAMVYAAMKDAAEEAKCLELAIRKFVKHPRLPLLQEYLTFRCHESSLQERKSAYRLILIAIKHTPHFTESRETKKLLQSLQNHWEELYFFDPLSSQEQGQKESLILRLSFRLAKKETLLELIDSLMLFQEKTDLLEDALFGLIELGFVKDVHPLIPTLFSLFPKHDWSYLSKIVSFHRSPQSLSFHSLFSNDWMEKKQSKRACIHVIEEILASQQPHSLDFLFSTPPPMHLSKRDRSLFDSFHLWYLLLQKDRTISKEIFSSYPAEILSDENSPLHFLYGIWLYCNEGTEIAKAHFSKVMETPHPPSSSLLSHFLLKRISLKSWGKEAFFYEKRKLFRQLALFYRCIEDKKKALRFQKLSRLPPKSIF
jgi:serine/threonine-protein kinase